MEIKKVTDGPSGPKWARANEDPLGPLAAFFGFMTEIGHNFLVPFKKIGHLFSAYCDTIVFGISVYFGLLVRSR